jgi:glycosyltransferase involved in cell wall biosynthesis
MTELRKEKGIIQKEYLDKQLIVPIGTDLIVRPLPFNKVNRYELGFIGHLRKGHGLQLLIESFADVVGEIPKAKMVIIGKGELENYLKHRCKILQISSDVNFLGYVENHKEALKRLSLCVVGLAPYEDNENTFTRYADPGKPKVYLSVGLPIIITKVPAISKKIKETECGIVIDYDKAQLTKSIMDILTNDDLAKKLRTNAVKLRDSFSWERVFKDALKKTLEI